MPLGEIIDQAVGLAPADFLISNARVLNLVTGQTEVSDIAINRRTGMIVSAGETGLKGVEVLDVQGELFAVPGFIDCHVHIESAMVTPAVFDEAVLPHGTTTAFCDPHEISNVLGAEALRYFIESAENMLMDLMVGLSSCVPATGLETSGAVLDATALAQFIDHPAVYGVAEFMSIADVLAHDPVALEKLARFAGQHIDGHMPFGVTTAMMNAMKACGIRNCHENTDLEHARDKLRRGIQVFIREGTVCKDAKVLAGLINEFQSPFLGFCTDDRSPVDIDEEGHIDHIIRTLIAEGADVATVYRIASWSAANHFGMAGRNARGWRPRGLIAADNLADLVLLRDLETCDIHSVYKGGELLTAEKFAGRRPVAAVGFASMRRGAITGQDLVLRGDNQPMPLIGLVRDQIVTTYEEVTVPAGADGQRCADPDNDILYIAVIERHARSNGNIARGFVRGFGIREGAMAVSVGHDSHNITVVGANHADMVLAVNRVIALDGGKVVVKNRAVLGELSLPIAGLMSDSTSLAQAAQEQRVLLKAAAELGSHWQDPLMLLGFLPLCVIPDARITDFGITRFNPAAGIMEPVLIDDQRA